MSRDRWVRSLARRREEGRLRGERGTVIPLMALMVSTLIVSVSFSVDVGRLTSKKRDLQSVVDLVALDAARVINGESAAVLYPKAEMAADESALRNEFVANELESLSVELGIWNFSEREFYPLDETSLAAPNAVHVVAGARVEAMFSAFDFSTSRQATAVRRIPGTTTTDEPCDPSDPACTLDCLPGDPGCSPPTPPQCTPGDADCPMGSLSAFSLGSFLAGFQGAVPPEQQVFVDQKVGFLNVTVGAYVRLPGNSWNVALVGYQGLAAADVTLDQLRVAGAFGSVDQLLAAQMTFAQYAALTLVALTNENGGTGGASAEALNALAVAATATSTTTFTLGQMIEVHQGTGGSAAGGGVGVGPVELNVLETTVSVAMLSAAVDIADGGSALSIPISTTIPGVTTSTMRLAVIEPPVIAVGPAGTDASGNWLTQAQTAQLRAQIDTVFQPPAPPAGFLPGTSFFIPIVLDGGSAHGALGEILCMPLDDETETVLEVDLDALDAFIGTAASMTSDPLVVDTATIVTAITGNTQGRSVVQVAGTSETLAFLGPYNHDNRQDVFSTAPAAGVGTALDVNLQVTPVTSQAALQAALVPYLTPFDDLVLEPLASTFGLQVAGARVTAFHIDCGVPVIVD